MPAAKYDMYVEQGVPYSIDVEYLDPTSAPKDLTGFIGKGSIKKQPWDVMTIANFIVTVTDPLAGKVNIKLNHDSLKDINFNEETIKKHLECVYDVILYKESSNEVIRLVQGKVFISPGVTTL